MIYDAHVLTYYEAMTSIYTDAAMIGISVAHIAEFWLECWWRLVPIVEVEQRVEMR